MLYLDASRDFEYLNKSEFFLFGNFSLFQKFLACISLIYVYKYILSRNLVQARVVRVKTMNIPRTAIPALLEIRILLSIAFPGSADASFLNEAAVRPDALKAWSQRARGQTD